jgi:hypothetical protein
VSTSLNAFTTTHCTLCELSAPDDRPFSSRNLVIPSFGHISSTLVLVSVRLQILPGQIIVHHAQRSRSMLRDSEFFCPLSSDSSCSAPRSGAACECLVVGRRRFQVPFDQGPLLAARVLLSLVRPIDISSPHFRTHCTPYPAEQVSTTSLETRQHPQG